MIAHIAIFTVSLVAGIILTPIVIRMAAAWGIFDPPHEDRRVHTEPLPRIGGVAVFAAVGAGLLTAAFASIAGIEMLKGRPSFFAGVLFGGGIIFATGLVDDLRGLRPGAKLAAQLIAAVVVYTHGFRIEVLGIGGNELSLGWLSLPLTLLWIVGVTNAFNLIDGLDGLATGIALVALGATLTVSVAIGVVEVSLLCVALIGALLGFLRYNFAPARIFLGDSGSLFIGFMLAVLSVHGSQKTATAMLTVVPLFALAIPLLDTSLAILRRWLRGVPFSQADGRHIHHRLLALGLTHRHAVIVLYVAACVLALLGLSLVFAPPVAVVAVSAAGAGVTLFLLLYGLRRLQYHEFAEFGAVLASGLHRAKAVVRDQIHAQDLGNVLRQAVAVEEVNAILEDNASTFEFLHMEVCREGSQGSRSLVLFNGHAARAWKLDYPVTSHDFVEGNDYVLRIWCNPRKGLKPYGAERVAQILAPVIEEWMAVRGPQRAVHKAPVFSSADIDALASERAMLEAAESAQVAGRLALVRPAR